MSNNTPTSPFPATRQDLSDLKQIARDAASDLTGTASVHAAKAKDQVQDLAGHFRDESFDQARQFKGNFDGLVKAASDYALERPLTCLGAAFVGGFIVASLLRRSRD